MDIIPVIDLLNGQVVHAKMGNRTLYQPIQSQLCRSSDPLAICQALLELYPFKTLYIADLNAIQKQNSEYPHHFSCIQTLQDNFPHLHIWLDAGISNTDELSIWENQPYTLVLGSENFAQLSNYLLLKSQLKDFILSLDFFSDGFKGPTELLSQPEHWPTRVIAMSLTNVGASIGPNMALLKTLQTNHSKLIAAGGVRHSNDLIILRQANIHAVLVASALHQGALNHAEISNL